MGKRIEKNDLSGPYRHVLSGGINELSIVWMVEILVVEPACPGSSPKMTPAPAFYLDLLLTF